MALLIPGLDGTGRLFCQQVAPLQDRYRVRAWGFSKRSRFGLADLVEELVEGTRQEALGTIAVVGESFGGAVAIAFVLACPERARSLTLINAFPVYRHRLRINLASRLFPALRWPGLGRLKDLIADRILASEGVSPEGRRTYYEGLRGVDPAGYRQRLEIRKCEIYE